MNPNVLAVPPEAVEEVGRHWEALEFEESWLSAWEEHKVSFVVGPVILINNVDSTSVRWCIVWYDREGCLKRGWAVSLPDGCE